MTTVHDKYLVKMEKTFNLWVGDKNRKCVPINGNVFSPESIGPIKRL